MSFIRADLDDVREAEVVEEGEYDLRIIKAEDGESKSGNPMVTLLIRIEDAPIANPAPVRHWMLIPDAATPPEQKQMRLLEIKRLLQCFGIKYDGGFDTEDLVGATGRAFLVQEEGDNGEVYNRLRLPRLKG